MFTFLSSKFEAIIQQDWKTFQSYVAGQKWAPAQHPHGTGTAPALQCLEKIDRWVKRRNNNEATIDD